MTENEQIQGMARAMCGEFECGCDDCDNCTECDFWIEASTLYAKGYRKVERGEWITPWVMKPYGKAYGTPYCSVCKQIDERKGSFCPNCGADMRGDKDE